MSSEPLLPFSGDDIRCNKCWHDHAYTRYMSGKNWADDPLTSVEHLERECCRCGFRWAEAIVVAVRDPRECGTLPAVRGG